MRLEVTRSDTTRSHFAMLAVFGEEQVFRIDQFLGKEAAEHFDLAEPSKLSLSFYGKRPGSGMVLDKRSLQFALHETDAHEDVLEAYERLILDAMSGDRTLFTNADGIERLWEVAQPLLESPPEVQLYERGSWEPKAMHNLVTPFSAGDCPSSAPGASPPETLRARSGSRRASNRACDRALRGPTGLVRRRFPQGMMLALRSDVPVPSHPPAIRRRVPP